ncbi:hypothetical protein Vretimale_6050 [Volvox reticuliferus]|uniref:fructose-bisphosphate aldolase n=1 Tax=Volvox reticuliferus TaxID=1737510 RepID=A0A8J4G6U2_9CHLO|nr:hypothetical protein Vretimale_6050 [Volvox reticuliferus]
MCEQLGGWVSHPSQFPVPFWVRVATTRPNSPPTAQHRLPLSRLKPSPMLMAPIRAQDIRRAYRELYYTTPGMGQYISGVIMFKETLYQSTAAGRRFVDVLADAGIMAGIKVDEGLAPLPGGGDGETYTKGLEGLEAACREYASAGAKFAKWRATLKVTDSLPSDLAVERNAEDLARYAKVCQECGLVPVVEPEILIDGAHSQARFGVVTERVLGATVAALWRHGVALEGCLLKPQMVIPGAEAEGGKVSAGEVARHTVAALRR